MSSLLVIGLAGSAFAQTSAAEPRLKDAYAGDCAAVVVLAAQRAGDVVTVQIGLGSLAHRTVADPPPATVEVPTGTPLQKGEGLRLLVNGSEIVGARATTRDAAERPAGTKPTGKCTATPDDGLEQSFDATAYYGRAYDTFAPDVAGGYPPDTVTAKHNRQLFGVDFDYRAGGRDTSPWQFRIVGETLHGVRSADISCVTADEKKSALCAPKQGVEYAHAILQNQSSLEAYVSPRLGLKRLQAHSSTPTWLYATARFGVIALAGAPRAFKSFHVGVGLAADGGLFEGSGFEVGWGQNELFGDSRWHRLKVDGLLSFGLDVIPGIRDKSRFFIEMYLDNDVKGNRPDCIQTFIGFDFDVRKFFGG